MPSLIDSLHLNIALLIAVAFAALLLLAGVAVRSRGSSSWLARIQRKSLMTANEKEFFARLQRALPGHLVFPQVSFAAILTHDSKLSPRNRWAVRNRFDRKIADFVVCNRNTLEIVAIVELDDRTHSSAADRKRDELTKAAGYQTIRFQSKQKPTEAEIVQLFKHSEALSVSKQPELPRAARR